MFKILKELFVQKKEPEKIEIELNKLEEWFTGTVRAQQHHLYFEEYFGKIKSLRMELDEKVETLRNQPVSEKDKKQVEARVQNIVTGHRDNYCKEIERFAEKLIPLENIRTMRDFQNAIEFNTNLDAEIQQVAQRTNKAYQATQHMFFDQVEPVFKVMGEMNILVKKFDAAKIEELQEVQTAIKTLNTNIQRKKDMELSVQEKKLNIENLQQRQKEHAENLEQLQNSEELKTYNTHKDQEQKLKGSLAAIDNDIFSYFAKLQKPLKKYQRIALDDTLIKQYVEDSVAAFRQDSELKIMEVLDNLKQNLGEFDEKQQRKFVELIGKKGFLTEVATKRREVETKIQEVVSEISSHNIVEKVESAERKVRGGNEKIYLARTELEELESAVNRINIEQNMDEISEKAKQILDVELIISSS